MKKGDAEKKIKELYAGFGWTNFFTHIRFWTGSFNQIEPYVPMEGTILDLGCGYGIFANYLGVSSKKRNVIGVDFDRKKIKGADRGIVNTTFYYGDATKMNLKNIKSIILLDVLHHLKSYKAQEDLIRKSKKLLMTKGMCIILEVDDKPLWKLVLARIADFLLYSGQPVYYGYRTRLLPVLHKYFGENNVKIRPLQHNPFPHVLYICEKT